MTCVNKLLGLRMVKDTQPACLQFMDQKRTLMTRLRAHLYEGGLDLVEVLEIMVLIHGLPQSGGWPVLAMTLSADETLRFASMCDRQIEAILLVWTTVSSDPPAQPASSSRVKGRRSTESRRKARGATKVAM